MNRSTRIWSLLAVALLAIVVAAGVYFWRSGKLPWQGMPAQGKQAAGRQAEQSGGKPMVEVSVAAATAETIVDYRDFTGRTAAVNSVDIRPRVSGYLLQTPHSQEGRSNRAEIAKGKLPDGSAFHPSIPPDPPKEPSLEDEAGSDQPLKNERETLANAAAEPFIVEIREGDRVHQGDPLFEIDPEPYRLAYLQAVGSLQSARAQIVKRRQDLARQEELLVQQAISQAQFDATVASVAEAAGSIENLRASVDRAYLDWKYTQLRSPIDGLVGRSMMTRGNLAVADTTVLTSVVTTDPIYVYFEIDEATVLDYRSRIQKGQVKSARVAKIDVDMALANDAGFPYHGVIDFVDNTTNPDTGNTRLRARFDNPDDALSPGLFARIRAPFTAPYEAILIPTKALAADQQGEYVLVVDDKNQLHRRAIVVGPRRDELSVIREGIAQGERVVVSGLQRARDGMTVKIAEEKSDSEDEPQSAEKTASEPAR